MSQSPRSTFHQAGRPLRACLLMELEGIRHPSGPSVTINGLDPCAASAMAPPQLDSLHVAQHPISQTKWDGIGVHTITPPKAQ
jgi:hypothetical protein